MRERLINIGMGISEFLKTAEGCEDVVFEKRSEQEHITFQWTRHCFYINLERSGGGIRLGDVAEQGRHQDPDVAGDMEGIPFVDDIGPIGRIPSACSVDIIHVSKSQEKGERDKLERVLRLNNPDEVHLLPAACVQKLDEILLQDVVRFLKRHFLVWKHSGFDLRYLTHPRHC